jgi:hypothetical protein
MSFPTFSTSGAVNAATVASGVATATQLTTGDRKAVAIDVQNGSNQPLQLFFNRSVAPSGAGEGDVVVLPGQSRFFVFSEIGRFVGSTIFGRLSVAGTGTLVINVVR